MAKIETAEMDPETYVQSLNKIADAANRAADAIGRVNAALDTLEGRDFAHINITSVGEVAKITVEPVRVEVKPN